MISAVRGNAASQWRREAWITGALLLWSVLASLFAVHEVVLIGLEAHRTGDVALVVSQSVFLLCMLVVLAGSWAYLIPRRAHYLRAAGHLPASVNQVKASLQASQPSLTILVPSYKEELQVVRQTLMSAALQDLPGRRVVLLIDDPQHPADPVDAANLMAMRKLPGQLQALFDRQADQLRALMADLAQARDDDARRSLLMKAHGSAQAWFAHEIRGLQAGDHSSRWLATGILQPMLEGHAQASKQLRHARSGDAMLSEAAVAQALDELVARFALTFTSFERKRYANLSHEPNKAMNLNAYLGLMGGLYHEVESACGKVIELLPAVEGAPDAVAIPDSDFVLTLDADSLLLSGYAARLAEVMLRPGNERMAVIQTPYSAVPDAPGMCERIAGAQTDIQYIMHQGYTAHDATFWVGANALLRKAAIEDIATVHMEEGKWVKKYIHDRTVIEDTESSIDLVDKGWTLFNYPERLAYSATPPDFGSLLIQRRRWADGGLIILPKALRYLARSGPLAGLLGGKWAEGFLRIHYLSSVATVNFAFLLMMYGPFAKNQTLLWMPMAMLAYMVAYARDLKQCGYRWSDFPKVYALNLLLLPVNLGGTIRSLYQAATGRRAAFARTPKVTGRTAMPGGYVLVEFLMLALSMALAVSDFVLGHWVNAAMSALYSAFLIYGITVFIGWQASLEDLRLWLWPARGQHASARSEASPMAVPVAVTQQAPDAVFMQALQNEAVRADD